MQISYEYGQEPHLQTHLRRHYGERPDHMHARALLNNQKISKPIIPLSLSLFEWDDCKTRQNTKNDSTKRVDILTITTKMNQQKPESPP